MNLSKIRLYKEYLTSIAKNMYKKEIEGLVFNKRLNKFTRGWIMGFAAGVSVSTVVGLYYFLKKTQSNPNLKL